MTWFLHEVRRKPGFRSSGRPTPVRRLPIDLRRAASPHAAPRQTQRFPPSRQASTSAERVADGDAETMRKQGANFAVLSSRGWRVPDLAVSCPRKGFQNHWFWRRSFLPFFRRRKKGSRRRQDRSREVRIATGAVRPRNDMFFARGAVQARFQVVREADPCAPFADRLSWGNLHKSGLGGQGRPPL